MIKKILAHLQSFFYLLPNVLRNFFSPAVTHKYPFQKHTLPERFRGRVSIHAENCIGCSLCVRDCPAHALEIEKQSRTEYRLLHYRNRCTYCGQCEVSCRYDAIHMTNEYIAPTSDKETFFVVLVDRTEGEE